MEFKHKIAIFPKRTLVHKKKIKTFIIVWGLMFYKFKIYETKIRNSFKHCSYAVFSFRLLKISKNKKKKF